MSASDDTEKQHEPTQKKLDDARRKGEIPRSNDLSAAVAFGGFLLTAWLLGSWVSTRLGALGVSLFRQAGWGGSSSGALGIPPAEILTYLGRTLAPVLLVPGVAVLAALVARRGLVFAPSKISPRVSRISPVANAKNKFGRSGLFEFLKATIKLIIVSGALAVFLRSRAAQIGGAMWLEPQGVAVQLGRLSLDFLGLIVVLLAVIGVVDLMWQKVDHTRRNRMSRKEVQDETKDSEGDPHLKQHRRQRAQEIALNSMLQDVPDCAVVIVNPEHYAVALKWSPASPGPPLCMAKGTDHIAARIREAAQEAGVPIHRDPPTARALFASVAVGDEIPPEQYRAVAAAIRFADKMRTLARKGVLE